MRGISRVGAGSVFLLALVARSLPARAVSSSEKAAETANDPTAFANSLQVQPSYTDIREGGNASRLLVRLVLSYDYFLLPGLRVKGFYSLMRVELYGQSLNVPAATAAGLEDLPLFDLVVKPYKWGAIGAGIAGSLPTATAPSLGSGKLQLGPATGVIVRVPHFQLGVLIQGFFSVAGDASRPDLGRLLIQPLFVLRLPRAFFFNTNGIMSFDFRSGPSATIPVNLGFGHAFTPQLVIQAQVEGVTTGAGTGNFTFKIGINVLGW